MVRGKSAPRGDCTFSFGALKRPLHDSTLRRKVHPFMVFDVGDRFWFATGFEKLRTCDELSLVDHLIETRDQSPLQLSLQYVGLKQDRHALKDSPSKIPRQASERDQ